MEVEPADKPGADRECREQRSAASEKPLTSGYLPRIGHDNIRGERPSAAFAMPFRGSPLAWT